MNLKEVELINGEIIYKKINIEDFTPYGFTAVKQLITPNVETGYISEQIKNVFDFETKGTVVINAGVGQGKTSTIIEIAKALDDSHIIVFAVPYLVLIDQYLNEFEPSKVCDFRQVKSLEYINSLKPELQNKYIANEEAVKRKVHLITINGLLGNPGDNYVQQSEIKREYFNALVGYAKKESKKVVFIFDEIHDGFQNFRQKYIFNLWKWKDVIHKAVLISATFNEASKEVIKYIAEITNKQIQILETERFKIEDKQSDLFLLFYNKYYDANNDDFTEIFRYLLSRDKKLNVLSYSKSVSEKLIDKESKVGKLLIAKYGAGGINLCVSNTENKFDNYYCNVGTRFSTGISIKDNEGEINQNAFVILMPTEKDYQNRNLGIFSNGINTVIQSLARLRDKGEIYIIMPSPKSLIKSHLTEPYDYTIKAQAIEGFQRIVADGKYFDINRQKELIEAKYKEIKDDVIAEINYINSIERHPSLPLKYPILEEFLLIDGEKVLATGYDIFGKNLSKYIFWAAFNDQFLNCRLKAVSIISILNFKEGRIIEELVNYANRFFYEMIPSNEEEAFYSFSRYFNFASDKECYERLRSSIFNLNRIFIECTKNGEPSFDECKSYTNPSFEKNIVAITQLLKKQNIEYYKRYYTKNYVHPFDKGEVQDNLKGYDIADYLLACMTHAIQDENEYAVTQTDEEKLLINSYKIFAAFFNNFKTYFLRFDDNNKPYLENTVAESDFIRLGETEIEKLKLAAKTLKELDPRIKAKVFSFMQNKEIEEMSTLEFFDAIYSIFKREFFQSKEARFTINGSRSIRKYAVNTETSLPLPQSVLNLLYIPKNTWIINPAQIGDKVTIHIDDNHPLRDNILQDGGIIYKTPKE